MPIDRNINKLRFFFIVLVVLIHSHNTGLVGDSNLVSSTCYVFFDNIITKEITRLATPGLFMISGYLFCKNMKEWNTDVYVSKLRRRFWSILVPYAIWNMMKLATLIVEASLKHGSSGISYVFREYNGWHLLWDGGMPYHSPVMLVTWYLRDLMVFFLFVPVLHYLIRKTLILPYLLIALCSIVGIWPTEHVCVASNLAFFTLGMSFTLLGGGRIVNKNAIRTTTLFAIVGVIALLFTDYDWTNFIVLPIIITAIYFHIHKISIPQHFVEASTFIYLAHGLLFHSLCRIAVSYLLPYDGTFFSVVRLLVIPTLTITLLTILHIVLAKYAKGLLNFLTGNRTHHIESEKQQKGRISKANHF